MDALKSFKGYGKADEAEDREFRRKTRKRLTLIILSLLLLLAVAAAAVAGALIHKRNTSPSAAAPSAPLSRAASIKLVCNVTPHPDACVAAVSPKLNATTVDPEAIFKVSLRVAMDKLSNLSSTPDRLASKINGDPALKAALSVCRTVFRDSVDSLNDSVSSMDVGRGETMLSTSKIASIRTWLSTALTDLETCLDGLQDLNSSSATSLLHEIRDAMSGASDLTSNSLAIVAKILGLMSEFDVPLHRRRRRLLTRQVQAAGDGFPEWVGDGERRLLESSNPAPDMTVSADGTARFRSVQAAVDAVPEKKTTRTVIYVKRGTYTENVKVDKKKWNIMIYGDGAGLTTISGGLNFIDGIPTFHTATFAVAGMGFMARDIKFENTAGPAKHQAVAFRSGSDQSVVFRCAFDGFQDTLYAHSNRQFYRECNVTGTIDFIFGNAAAVFQKCAIRPRQPMANQFNTITAQGKKETNMNSAISIDECVLEPLDNLTAVSYLGRPWKTYSTTVVVRSRIGAFIDPKGWVPWIPGAEPPNTIYYREHLNIGPGADVRRRVSWAGYRSNMTDQETSRFSVSSLLQGGEWLGATHVPVSTPV